METTKKHRSSRKTVYTRAIKNKIIKLETNQRFSNIECVNERTLGFRKIRFESLALKIHTAKLIYLCINIFSLNERGSRLKYVHAILTYHP